MGGRRSRSGGSGSCGGGARSRDAGAGGAALPSSMVGGGRSAGAAMRCGEVGKVGSRREEEGSEEDTWCPWPELNSEGCHRILWISFFLSL